MILLWEWICWSDELYTGECNRTKFRLQLLVSSSLAFAMLTTSRTPTGFYGARPVRRGRLLQAPIAEPLGQLQSQNPIRIDWTNAYLRERITKWTFTLPTLVFWGLLEIVHSLAHRLPFHLALFLCCKSNNALSNEYWQNSKTSVWLWKKMKERWMP